MEETKRSGGRLTNEEIEYIVSSIKRNKYLPLMYAKSSLEDVKRAMRILLREVEDADKRAIPLFIEKVNLRYEQATIKPGTPVGLRAALAIMSHFAQETLNTHRSSGTLNDVNSGVDGVKELMTATPKMKNPSMLIVYKNPNIGFSDALGSRSFIVGSTISSLMDKQGSSNGPRSDVIDKVPDWYKSYSKITGNDYTFKTLPKYVLRIKLDKYQMFINKVTTNDVCKKISASSSKVICIPSPTSIGIVDIYPITEEGTQTSMSNMIRSAIVPNLDKIVVKGIKGVKSLQPTRTTVWSSVYQRRAPNGQWDIVVDPNNMSVQGIGIDNVIPILKYTGMKIKDIRPKYIRVEVPYIDGIDGEITPNKVYKYYESINDKRRTEFEKKRQSDKNLRFEESNFDKISMYTYARTFGSNMKGLIRKNDVDIYKSYPNNVNTIYKMFGIEATRSFISSKLISMIRSNGSDIDPRNVLILADAMTFRGMIMKMTNKSMQAAGPGFFTKASYTEPYMAFVKAAVAGSSEKIGNLPTSLLVGHTPRLGSGFSKEFQPRILRDGKYVGAVDDAKKKLKEQMLSYTHGLSDSQLKTLRMNNGVALQTLNDINKPIKMEESDTVFSRRVGVESNLDVMVTDIDVGEVTSMMVEPAPSHVPGTIPSIIPSAKTVIPTISSSVGPIQRLTCKRDRTEMVESYSSPAMVQEIEDAKDSLKREKLYEKLYTNPSSFIPEIVNDMRIPRSLLLVLKPPIKMTDEDQTDDIEYGLKFPISKISVRAIDIDGILKEGNEITIGKVSMIAF